MEIHSKKNFKIDKLSGSGLAWETESESSGYSVCLGPIGCSEGDEVEAVLITGKRHSPYSYGICTNVDLWQKSSPELPQGGVKVEFAESNEIETISYNERVLNQFTEEERAEIQVLLSDIESDSETDSHSDCTPTENQDESKSSTSARSGVYLVPVSDNWRERFSNSVEEPHDLQQYGDVPPQIEGIDRLRIWGTTETDGDKKQSAIDQMSPDDCLLFYHNGEFFAGGIVGRTFDNPDVGELLWNNSESRHLFTVENFTHNVPAIEEMWDMLGYEGRLVVQGFTRAADERVSNIREEHGSVESLILGTDAEEPSQEEIEEEKSELAKTVESDPQLTEDEIQYVETHYKARDSAFRELVRDTYNNTCAVCGSQRESPDGNPEVEAAHIYPHSEGGSDDIRNGIALCKFHHWAFDSGWLSFNDDHEIIVAEATDKNGYHELKQLEGQSLRLPENEDAHPHSIFLEQHRERHGFEG